ncbi:MAG: tetratricopeptide repeat protein [Bdellovibrionales bacterium]|nr:tetratricopeptide repeat protein [Bdellovibrionales bacterium]
MRVFIALIYIFISFFTVLSQSQDIAQDLQTLKKRLQRKSTHSMSKRVSRKFRRIHTWMMSAKKENVDRARKSLKEIIDASNSHPSEQAKALLLLGEIYSLNNNYTQAVQSYEQALQGEHVSYYEYLKYLLTLAHRYMALENYDKAQSYVQKWMALKDKDRPTAYALLAFIYYQKGKKKEALAEIERAINMSETPRKLWLGFSASLYMEFKRYDTAEQTLHRLLALYPSSQMHWRQVSAVFLNSPKQKSSSALAAYQLAHKVRPLDTEGGSAELIRLLLDQGIPYTAAKHWEKAIQEEKVKGSSKNYEILGDSWMRAEEKDKALQAYKKAAEKSDKGTLWLKLGVIYLSDGKWKSSIDSMKKALSKEPDIEDADAIYIRMGFAYYNLGQYQEALDAYKSAEKIRGDYEIQARQQSREMKKFL